MELRQLLSFVTVAEDLHFGRAAERLHLAQPAVSNHLRRLEADLGVRLLERTARGVSLTDAGAAFLPEARAAVTQVERAARVAERSARGQVGRLRVGHLGLACSKIVPEVLASFHRETPEVELLISQATGATQLSALVKVQLDVGFVTPPVLDERLDSETIRSEPFVVALPSCHPLAQDPDIALADLAGETIVVYPRAEDANMHDRIVRTCEKAGFDPETETLWPMTSVLVAVAAGLGISLVPESVSSYYRPPGVCYRPLADQIEPVELAVVRRRGERSPLVAAFCALASRIGGTSSLALMPAGGSLPHPRSGDRPGRRRGPHRRS